MKLKLPNKKYVFILGLLFAIGLTLYPQYEWRPMSPNIFTYTIYERNFLFDVEQKNIKIIEPDSAMNYVIFKDTKDIFPTFNNVVVKGYTKRKDAKKLLEDIQLIYEMNGYDFDGEGYVEKRTIKRYPNSKAPYKYKRHLLTSNLLLEYSIILFVCLIYFFLTKKEKHYA